MSTLLERRIESLEEAVFWLLGEVPPDRRQIADRLRQDIVRWREEHQQARDKVRAMARGPKR